MKQIKNIFNGKSAFQSINMKGISRPISDEERVQLQNILVEIYRDILTYCQEKGWTPYLVGGSALGAVRHKGFIPWDDDLDVGMLRDEYEKFITEFESEYGSKYIVNSPGKSQKAKVRFTKVLKKSTVFKELIAIDDDDLNCIFVDIFPIDNVSNNRIIRTMKGIYADCLAYISSQVFNYYNRSAKLIEALKRTGKLNYAVRMLTGHLFGVKKPDWWFQKYDSAVRCKDSNSVYCTISAGRKHYFGEMIERDKVVPARYIDFCGIQAPVFRNVEFYLSNMYGNYMEIPPAEKRERHYIQELSFDVTNNLEK